MSTELIATLASIVLLVLKAWLSRSDNTELMKEIIATQKQLDILSQNVSGQMRTDAQTDKPKAESLQDAMDADLKASQST